MKNCLCNLNTGVIIKEIKPTDYIAGAESGISFEERLPNGNWDEFIPTNEKQSGKKDTMACVSYSGLNSVETQINYFIKRNFLKNDQVKFLEELGFFDENGSFNCSDAFTAKMSGTTPNGNDLTSIWQSFKDDGLLPQKDLSFNFEADTWEGLYPNISNDLIVKAKEIFKIFSFSYEWVYYPPIGDDFGEVVKSHLRHAPLQIAAPVCPSWNTSDIISPCGKTNPEHATIIYGSEDYWKDFDHYDPFRKRLSYVYYIPYVLKGVVNIVKETPPPISEVFKYNFTRTMKFGESSGEVAKLQKALKVLGFFPQKVKETGYFGSITAQAVLDFWIKYKIANWYELKFLKGKVAGPKTIKQLNLIFK